MSVEEGWGLPLVVPDNFCLDAKDEWWCGPEEPQAFLVFQIQTSKKSVWVTAELASAGCPAR